MAVTDPGRRSVAIVSLGFIVPLGLLGLLLLPFVRRLRARTAG